MLGDKIAKRVIIETPHGVTIIDYNDRGERICKTFEPKGKK